VSVEAQAEKAPARPVGPQPLPVVLLHGLLSTPREFGLISLPLQSRGVELIIPHIKGYTEGDRTRFTHWQEWVDAAAEAIHEQVGVDRPFVLGGLCTGGMVAAAVALRGEFNIQSLVMLSPSFGYDGWGRDRWWGWRKLGFVLGIDRWISIRERSPYGIKNEKIRRWVERDMEQRASSAAGPSALPLWGINQSERLMRYVVKRLPGLHTPTVIMTSTEDEICTVASVRRVFDTLPGDANRLVVLENSFHMITIDNDRQQVTAELLKCAGKIEHLASENVQLVSGASSKSPIGAFTAPDAQTGKLA
jgi:carboxylesterase